MALILIVDDSPTEVHVMQKALEQHGFRHVAAADGAEGDPQGARDAPRPDLHGRRDAGRQRLPGDAHARQRSGDAHDPGHHDHVQGPGDRPHLGDAPGRGRLPGQARVDGQARRRRHKPRSRADHGSDARSAVVCATVRSSCCVELDAAGAQRRAGPVRDARRPVREWVGIAFRLGGERFLVAREETREVLAYPTVVTRVPGAKLWIRGSRTCAASCCRSSTCGRSSASGTTNVRRARRAS